MNVEFDETGQESRLRRGIIEVSGVMPVLVSCQHPQRIQCFLVPVDSIVQHDYTHSLSVVLSGEGLCLRG